MLFQRFLDDRRASVAPLLALATIPIMGLIGASVDYGRASAARANLQAVADSTALALAQEMSKSANPGSLDLNCLAQTYFNALYAPTQTTTCSTQANAAMPVVTVSYSNTTGSQLVVQVTGSVSTMFMGIPPFNIRNIPISASSTANWGMARLRVALVLDNTGSMTQGGAGTPSSPNKIQALQTAAHNLLNQLQSAATNNGDVYVSIIPFTKDVNVDPSNYTQSWIDFTQWDIDNQVNVQTGQNCVTVHHRNGTQSQRCTPVYTSEAANHNTWNGCVTDRNQNDDTKNTNPTSSTLFPAEQYSVCPVALIPQSYDWTTLNAKIDAMVAAGNTDQAIGLAWGWQSLTSGTPLNAPAKDPNYQYQDIIIILSDGLNTEDRWYTDQVSIDNRQKILCDNIKTAGVTIYSIQVDTGGDPTSSVLQYCAGTKPQVADASKFFLLTSPNEIVTTFNQIGTGLSKLRLAY